MRKVRKIKLRINSSRKHIQCTGNNIKISSAFTISKEAAFNSFCTGKQTHFAAGNTFTTVVVIMHAYNNFFPFRNMSRKIFNLICKNIWHITFNSCRKIKNYFLCTAVIFKPFFFYSFTNFKSKINFCHCKTFRGVFKLNMTQLLCIQRFFYTAHTFASKFNSLFFSPAKSVFSLSR